MKKLNIIVDLDGITTNTCPAWLDQIYANTGVRAHPSDITAWDMTECVALASLKPEQIFGVLDEPGFTTSLAPMVGALDNLKKIHDMGHSIYFVTARHGKNSMPETMQWFDIWLPWVNRSKQVVFLHDKWHFKADVLIDDKAETLAKYGEANPTAHLITIAYPYNRQEIDGVFEVENDVYAWDNIHDYIQALAGAEDGNLY